MESPLPLSRYLDRPAAVLFTGYVAGFGLFTRLAPTLSAGEITLLALLLLAGIGLFLLARLADCSRREGGLLRSVGAGLLCAPLYTLYLFGTAQPQLQAFAAGGTTLYQKSLAIHGFEGCSPKSELHRYTVRQIDPPHLTLLLHTPAPLEVGSTIEGTYDIDPLSCTPTSSYDRYLLSKGVQAKAHLQELHRSSPIGAQALPLRTRLLLFRERLITLFDHSTEGYLSTASRGLIQALVLGERSRLGADIRADFSRSGVAHILAVSGFHLGVIYLLLSSTIGLLLSDFRLRYFRFALILLGLLAYTLLTGAAPSTLRALLMVLIYGLYAASGRLSDSTQVLLLTLLIIVTLSPWQLYSAGLILSASAVWGIATFFVPMRRLLDVHHPLLRRGTDLLLISIAAQIGVLPWLCYFFGTVPLTFLWSAIPVTLLAICLIPLASLSLLLCSVLHLPVLPSPLAMSMEWLAQGMIRTADLLSAPTLALDLTFDLTAVALYYAVAFSLLHLLHRPSTSVQSAEI